MKCPKCEKEIKDNAKFCQYCHRPIMANIRKLRLKKSISSLIFSIFALLSTKITMLCILFIITTIVLIIISYGENKHLVKFSILVTLIAATLLTTNLLGLTGNKNEANNAIVGTWGTLTNGGYFVFNKDRTYTEYLEKDKETNFCKGTFTHSYGYEVPGNTEKFIESDPDYNYYTVTLTPKECVIDGKKENNLDYLTVDRNLVFMISKSKDNSSIILNINTSVYHKVNKK